MCQVLAHLTLLNMTLWMCPDDVNLALPTTIFVPSPAQAPSPAQTPSPQTVPSPRPFPSPTQAPSPVQAPAQTPSPQTVPSSRPFPSPTQAPSPVQAPSPTRTPSSEPSPTQEPPPTQAPSPEPPPQTVPTPIRDRTPSPKNASTHGLLQSHRNNSRNGTEPPPVQPQDLAWLHFLWCIPIMALCMVLYHRRRAGSSSRILRLWAPKQRDVVRTQSEPVKGSEKVENEIVRSVSEIQVIL